MGAPNQVGCRGLSGALGPFLYSGESGGTGRLSGLSSQWPNAVRVRVPHFAPIKPKIHVGRTLQSDIEGCQRMLLNYEDVSSVKKIVEVEIPADLISAESQRVTSELSRQAKIDGFRPGKVPLGVVRTRFAKEIQEQVMERLLPRTFHEAIADKGVEVVGDPHLQDLDPFIEGAPVKYKAEFEVKPKFDLAE